MGKLTKAFHVKPVNRSWKWTDMHSIHILSYVWQQGRCWEYEFSFCRVQSAAHIADFLLFANHPIRPWFKTPPSRLLMADCSIPQPVVMKPSQPLDSLTSQHCFSSLSPVAVITDFACSDCFHCRHHHIILPLASAFISPFSLDLCPHCLLPGPQPACSPQPNMRSRTSSPS